MKDLNIKNHLTGRREFLSILSVAAAMGFIPNSVVAGAIPFGQTIEPLQQGSPMPMINLGPHKISRLICGSNPMLGNSYLGSHTTQHMIEYFTPEKTVEFLLKCEQAGITTHQLSYRLDYIGGLREKGSKMNIICLHSEREKIKERVETAKPIALVHHGGVTDRVAVPQASDA